MKLVTIGLAAAVFIAGGVTAGFAQTMSYSDAGGLIARSCGKDISKFCANENMGGGALKTCLMKVETKLNPQCVSDYKAALVSLDKRADAQAAVPKLCNTDARRFCKGVAPGDGNFLTCLNASKRVVSAACSQALADAGWN